MNNLGMLLLGKGDLAAAEPLLREALEMRGETLGSRHPQTLISIDNLNVLLNAKYAKFKDRVAAASAAAVYACMFVFMASRVYHGQ